MTIAEVSKKYDLTPDTLRYYERIGLLANIPRNKNGIRNYDEKSCKRIEFVKCMRNAGVEIEILIAYNINWRWYILYTISNLIFQNCNIKSPENML